MDQQDLLPYFQAASQRTGVPVSVLIAQARQESGLNPNAVGKAGEIGLTQIMPSTARSPGFGVAGVDPQSLRDPAANAMFGAQYLAGRAKAAGLTDWNDPAQVAHALKAYNGGGDPNYAQNVMRYMGDSPQQMAAGYRSVQQTPEGLASQFSQMQNSAAPQGQGQPPMPATPTPGLLGANPQQQSLGGLGLLAMMDKQRQDQISALMQQAANAPQVHRPTPFTGFDNGLLG